MDKKKSYSPDATTGFLLSAATLGLKRKLTRSLSAAGFPTTQEQQVILVLLWNEDALTQSELSERSYKDRHNISRITKALEQKKLIRKVPDKDDARLSRCVLTREGKALKGPLLALGQQNLDEAFQGIAKEDIAQLRKILMQLLDNLEEGQV